MEKYLYKNRQWLEEKYCKEELSVIEIARLCGVTRQTIHRWIYNFCFTRREVLRSRPKSRYSLNERYFQNINNGNKAYWLGFIAADGCVVNEKGRRHLYIELSEKDRCHVEAFKKEIEFEGPIYEMKARGRSKPSCKLQVGSSRMVFDLVELGVVQNKTKFLKRPNIPKKYYSDWIRGYFDGDGAISNRKDGNTGGAFLSSSISVMKFIVENIPGKNSISWNERSHIYCHYFGGKGTVEKIYKYMYKNSKICLKRKKDKFFLKAKV